MLQRYFSLTLPVRVTVTSDYTGTEQPYASDSDFIGRRS